MLSLEAMINNHRVVRTALDIRMTSEILLLKEHKKTAKQVVRYDSISANIDKYQRSFDLLRTILAGAGLALTYSHTCSTVVKDLQGYADLLNDYKTLVISTKHVESTDTIILHQSERMYTEIKDFYPQLSKSLKDLFLALSGATQYKTSELMLYMDSVTENLEQLVSIIETNYGELWAYMIMRKYYFNKSIFMRGSTQELIDGAYSSWMSSAILVSNSIKAQRPIDFKVQLGGGGLLGQPRTLTRTSDF